MSILSKINEKLWAKVMLPVFFVVFLVVSLIILFEVFSQKLMIDEQVLNQNRIIAETIEGAIFDALATGDNDIVRKQFKRLNEKISDIKVFVYDFDQTVAFSTENDSIGKKIYKTYNIYILIHPTTYYGAKLHNEDLRHD